MLMTGHNQHESINPSELLSTARAAGGDVRGVFVAEHSGDLQPIKHNFNATAYVNIRELTVKVPFYKLHEKESFK